MHPESPTPRWNAAAGGPLHTFSKKLDTRQFPTTAYHDSFYYFDHA